MRRRPRQPMTIIPDFITPERDPSCVLNVPLNQLRCSDDLKYSNEDMEGQVTNISIFYINKFRKN